jgi:hypothetical protein
MNKIFIDWIFNNSEVTHDPKIIIDPQHSYIFSFNALQSRIKKEHRTVLVTLQELFGDYYDTREIITLIRNLHKYIRALSAQHCRCNGKDIPFIYNSIIDIESKSAEVFCYDMDRRVVNLDAE